MIKGKNKSKIKQCESHIQSNEKITNKFRFYKYLNFIQVPSQMKECV